MWGHLCGFDMTATTATPDAVRTGFALSFGSRYFRYWSGIELITSVSRGCCLSLYFFENLIMTPLRLTSLDVPSEDTSSNDMSAQAWMNLSFSEGSFWCVLGPLTISLLFALCSFSTAVSVPTPRHCFFFLLANSYLFRLESVWRKYFGEIRKKKNPDTGPSPVHQMDSWQISTWFVLLLIWSWNKYSFGKKRFDE